MLRRLILLTMLALAIPATAAPTGPGAFKITGVAVDVVAANPVAARAAAYTLAERRAWPQLWARMTGNPASAAPHLADGAIEGMVAGVEIETEAFDLTRYLGRLSIVFDRERASAFLGGSEGQAVPMLLLPVLIDGAGTRTVYQAKTPWAAAWLRFRDTASAVDYVIPAASAGDNVVLTAIQSRRHDRALWRTVLARFKAADVLTAEVRLVRSWPGGPVGATVVARHGPDAVELGRASFRTATPAGVEAMLDEAVRAADTIYARALASGMMPVEPGLTIELAPVLAAGPEIGASPLAGTVGVEANVATPDAASLAATFAALKAVPGVVEVRILRLSLGATSRIVIGHADSDAALAYHLDQKGWRLAPEASGVLLRRRVAGDPAVPPPPTEADMAAAEAVAEPDATPGTAGAARPAGGAAAPVGGSARPAAAKPAGKPVAPPRDLLPPAARDPLAPR